MMIDRAVAWIAFALVMLVLAAGPRPVDLERTQARLDALEGKRCLLMAVNTPNGVSAICAGLQ